MENEKFATNIVQSKLISYYLRIFNKTINY